MDIKFYNGDYLETSFKSSKLRNFLYKNVMAFAYNLFHFVQKSKIVNTFNSKMHYKYLKFKHRASVDTIYCFGINPGHYTTLLSR